MQHIQHGTTYIRKTEQRFKY